MLSYVISCHPVCNCDEVVVYLVCLGISPPVLYLSRWSGALGAEVCICLFDACAGFGTFPVLFWGDQKCARLVKESSFIISSRILGINYIP